MKWHYLKRYITKSSVIASLSKAFSLYDMKHIKSSGIFIIKGYVIICNETHQNLVLMLHSQRLQH